MKTELREKQKQEALWRLKFWALHPRVLRDFQSGVLNKSESFGALFWLSDKEEDAVAKFEAKWDALVYHCILSKTEIGRMLTMLYVSKHPEEWSDDRADLLEGQAISLDIGDGLSRKVVGHTIYAYVENLDDPELSEIGSVMVSSLYGGMVRVY